MLRQACGAYPLWARVPEGRHSDMRGKFATLVTPKNERVRLTRMRIQRHESSSHACRVVRALGCDGSSTLVCLSRGKMGVIA